MKYSEVITRLQNLTKIEPNQAELVRITGTKQSTMSNRALRNSDFPLDEIEKLNKFYNINIITNSTQQNTSNTVSIVYYPNVYLSAGFGIEVYDENKELMTIDSRLLISEHGCKINPNHCQIVNISGNSMAPEYRHGDRVIIDLNDTELADGHIFAFRYNGQCFVKEINLCGDKIKCISLNKEYDPFYIKEGEQFTVFGRILPRIRL